MIELLRTKFVAAAVDCWYLDRAKDAAGEFYKKVVSQRQPFEPGVRSTQGFYAFAPDGTLLRGWNNRNVPRMREYLEQVLKDFKPAAAEELDATRDPRFQREIPEGAVVVDVYSKILEADWPPTDDEMIKPLRVSTGRDHLWILKDEIEALAAGRFPERLAKRIARYHLIDNTRGEPPMWEKREVEACDFAPQPAGEGRSRLTGHVRLATESNDRGYDAALCGETEWKDGQLVRFDLVARGRYHGHGRFTPRAPEGEFTLAVAFRLSGGGAPASVPPQGARDLREYLGR